MTIRSSSRGTAALLGVLAMSASVEAALGVPENLVFFRESTQTAFVQDRLDANSFASSSVFTTSSIGGPGDGIEIGDVNGDGIDDFMAVQDPGAPFDFNFVAGFSLPGPPSSFPFPGAGAANATGAGGRPGIDTPFVRRDFDGDSLADIVVAIDESLGEFDADVINWFVTGSDLGPLTSSGATPGGSFGNPKTFDSVPLVGDFNGDGIVDRMVHNSGTITTGGGQAGRVPQIDFTFEFLGENVLGDGFGDTSPQVIGSSDDDEVRAADINGDGFDDLVVLRPNEGVNQWEVEGWINQQVFDPVLGGTPTFVQDPAFFTFAGFLDAGDTIHFGAFPAFAPLPGDYNRDGVVDAADYTVARDAFGTQLALPNRDLAATTPFDVDQEELDFWASQFGNALPLGSSAVAVPEPGSAALAAFVGIGATVRRRS